MNLAKASPIEVADELVGLFNQMIISDDILYTFNGKTYETLTDFEIGQQIYNLYVKNNPEAWSPNKSNAITIAMKYHPGIKRVAALDDYDDYINLNNGILQFSTRTLIPHSPDFYFTSIVSIDYDPSPDSQMSPALNSLLDSIFTNDDHTPDIHTIDNIIQLGGYLIYPKIKMEKMFIFYGGGSNGKSLLIDYVYKLFFDRKFISSLSLNVLSNEASTARKQLLTSRVNFATEQRAGDLESEELKKVVTGEDISIERKYEDNINFKAKCKILIAGNRFIRFKDTSEGLRRRLLIFHFKNRFETNKKKYLSLVNPASKRIFPAADKDALTSALFAERSAILNMFLDGLQRLKDNNWQFYESENSEEIFNEYLEESDYLGTWLEEHFVPTPDATMHIGVKEIQDNYRKWWEYNFPDKKFDVSTKLMGRRIKDIFRIDSHRVNIFIDGKSTTTTVYYLSLKNKCFTEEIQSNTPTQETMV